MLTVLPQDNGNPLFKLLDPPLTLGLGGVVTVASMYLLGRGEMPVQVKGDPRGCFSARVGSLRRGDGLRHLFQMRVLYAFITPTIALS